MVLCSSDSICPPFFWWLVSTVTAKKASLGCFELSLKGGAQLGSSGLAALGSCPASGLFPTSPWYVMAALPPLPGGSCLPVLLGKLGCKDLGLAKVFFFGFDDVFVLTSLLG